MIVQRVLLKCVTTPLHHKRVSLTAESQGWQEDVERDSGRTSVWRPCWRRWQSCWVAVRTDHARRVRSSASQWTTQPDCGTLLCWQEDVEHASGWTSVMAASLEALAELQTDSTHGLCADFMAFDADAGRYRAVTTQVLERPGDGTFSWNACRCARGPTLFINLFNLD